jgi:endonuclease G
MSKKTKPEGPGFSEEELIELVRRKAQAYLRLSNVTSVGVGYKQTGGAYTDELSVQFTVQKKLALETLEAESLKALPSKFEVRPGVWVETDVLQRSYQQHARMVEDFRSAAEALDFPKLRRSRQETLSPGLSISHFRGTAGTLGAIVFDRESGEPLVLSNWHVLAGPGSQSGDRIHQPGPLDDSRTDKTLCGRLLRSPSRPGR